MAGAGFSPALIRLLGMTSHRPGRLYLPGLPMVADRLAARREAR